MDSVTYSTEDGVAHAALNRPEVLNAIDGDVISQLGVAVRRAAEDPAVKALIIRGEGRAFCTGVDLEYLEDILTDNARYFEFVHEFNSLLLAIEEAPVPTIAVIQDLALAGGLELLLACDFAIAAEDARIGDQHGFYGLMPGGGSTQRLPRRIGMQRAKELLFAADWISGSRAADIGLVLKAVPKGTVQDHADELASRFVPRSKRCMAMVKRAASRGAHLPMREALAQEQHALFEYFTSSPSPQVGLAAFRNRETPEFPE